MIYFTTKWGWGTTKAIRGTIYHYGFLIYYKGN